MPKTGHICRTTGTYEARCERCGETTTTFVVTGDPFGECRTCQRLGRPTAAMTWTWLRATM